MFLHRVSTVLLVDVCECGCTCTRQHAAPRIGAVHGCWVFKYSKRGRTPRRAPWRRIGYWARAHSLAKELVYLAGRVVWYACVGARRAWSLTCSRGCLPLGRCVDLVGRLCCAQRSVLGHRQVLDARAHVFDACASGLVRLGAAAVRHVPPRHFFAGKLGQWRAASPPLRRWCGRRYARVHSVLCLSTALRCRDVRRRRARRLSVARLTTHAAADWNAVVQTRHADGPRRVPRAARATHVT